MLHEAQVRSSRILVVDDLIANVSLLENVLSRLGYKQLKSITDPREVFSSTEQWKPDLIILDLAMPHLNGFKVMEQLRNQVPKEEWFPILVLTADTDPGTKRRALAAGATEFLPKPFDSSEILLRIRNLLLMRIYQSELRTQNRLLEDRVSSRTQSLSERTAELEEALAQLERTQHQVVQQERFRAFGEMAGGVAHDFNNVLMCVIGYTDLLLNDPAIMQEKETAHGFLRTMNQAGQDASKIVARLRDFYRPREENEIFTPIDLKALVEEVIPLTQPKWQTQALAAGRVIDVQLQLSTVPLVSGNPAEIREIVVNLIFNAVDAMTNGGTITLHTCAANGRVSLGVSDTGTGMTEEVRQRCMEPFFSTKGEEGTGLGLSMVFGILKRHEGSVDIETKLGQGTTFWIHLRQYLESAEALPAMDSKSSGESARSLHVLAVDDNPVARDVLARYLRADNHSVVSATNGDEGLRKFMAEPFDLVITDHAMPGMTGAELAIAIKAKDAGQPVLLLTGFSDSHMSATDLPAGVDMVVNKAISHHDLRQAMAKVLQREEAVATPHMEDTAHAA